MKPLRKGNLQLRECMNLVGETYYEIVKWRPNEFYNKTLEDYPYIKHIDKRLFNMKEVCYTVTMFMMNAETHRWNQRDIGKRRKELTSDELKIFKELRDHFRTMDK